MQKIYVLLLVAGIALFTACTDPMNALEQEIRAIEAQYPEAIVGVAVRDLGTGARLDYNAQRLFHAASTMKVPVMMEVFRQAELGRVSLTDSIPVVNAFRSIVDGSPYAMALSADSDEAIYDHIGQNMTVRQLVYQMITVSSNLATNILIDRFVADSVQQQIARWGTQHMQVLRGVEDLKAFDQGLNNTATAADLAVLFEQLANKTAVSESADEAMIEILQDQAFNEMIPAGLPEGTQVAHKTGWITRIQHDAGIVYPEDGAPYVVVILTEGIPEKAVSTELGIALTRAIHTALRGESSP